MKRPGAREPLEITQFRFQKNKFRTFSLKPKNLSYSIQACGYKINTNPALHCYSFRAFYVYRKSRWTIIWNTLPVFCTTAKSQILVLGQEVFAPALCFPWCPWEHPESTNIVTLSREKIAFNSEGSVQF